ncbi:MAG: hypothetical protein O7A03_09770, partial [Alphaproteobacteria bacterium]|nr:hypothetical protein [Alphaproteobacteria bacterium]
MAAEVVVRFATGTNERRLAAEALSGQPPGEARLSAMAEALSAELGWPIRFVQATSGQEWLISVDMTVVAERVVAHLRRHRDVSSATILKADGSLDASPRIRVEFRPDSRTAQSLLDPMSLDAAVTSFTAEISSALGFDLEASPVELPALIVSPAATSIVADLVDRLRRRGDVDYAQPNLMLQPFQSL